MINRELGTLKRIDAREIWMDEARDFTPWLKENIGVLGSALGMDLDLVESEVAVGPFSCDLMAKDVGGDRWVVIENQLEPTDHSHLGQLLTYGAGREASVFVWISPRFREEHRAAIDWLNEHSDERSHFFGVEIEVVVIDDAPKAAPNFKLVSSPNAWTKDQRAVSRPASPKAEAYEVFWARLLPSFKGRFPQETNAAKSTRASWYSLALGRSGFGNSWAFTADRRFRVEVYFDTGDEVMNKACFDDLIVQRSEIERRLGHVLDWDRLDGKRMCRISSYFHRQPINVMDGDDVLAPLIEWATTETKALRDVFRPLIATLSMAPRDAMSPGTGSASP